MKKFNIFLFYLSFFFFIYLLIPTKTQAYYEQWYMEEHDYDSRYCTFKNYTSYYPSVLSPNVNSIKFRQDDSYYYFDYDIDYISDTIKKSSYVDTTPGTDNIFVTQYQNMWPSFNHSWTGEYNGNYNCRNYQRSSGDISFCSYKFTYLIIREQAYSTRSAMLSDEYYRYDIGSKIGIPISGLKTDYYYNTPEYLHGYYYDYKLKKENGLLNGTANVSSSATSLSDDFWQYNYTGTVKIKKTEFLNYRYLSFLATDALKNMRYEENKSGVINGHWDKLDLRGYSIDLEPYRTCDHDWKFVNVGEKTYHEVVCSKCNWTKKENHDLLYEYDSIINNECICGYHDMIKLLININDGISDVIDKQMPSYVEIATMSIPNKQGNNFLWYDLYEKHKINKSTYSEIYIGTRSNLDMYSGNYSIRYDSVFEPRTYIFHYSTESNIGVSLNVKYPDQVFKYGEGQYLRDSEYIKGKSFSGWALSKGSDVADFKVGQIIKNYTDIDNATFILYPVYEKMYYYIRYMTNEGIYQNGDEVYLKRYSYDDNTELEIPFNDKKKVKVSYYNYNGKCITKLSELRDIARYKDTIFNLYAVISHSSGGGGSSSGDSDISSSYGPSGPPGASGNITDSSISGPGIIIGQDSENVLDIAETIDISKNLLYDNKIIKETELFLDKSIEKYNDLDGNVYSKNYENLMDYLRKKYENEKVKKDHENEIKKLSENIHFTIGKSPKFLSTLVYRHGGVLFSISAVIISIIWAFI